MPWTPLGPCRHPGCPNLQDPYCRGYCKGHAQEADREARRGRYRGSARARGYTTAYDKARRRVLWGQPLCVPCEEEGRVTVATMTHHIVPLAEGGTNDPDNLLPVCEECHQRLHRGKGGRRQANEGAGFA